MKQLTYIFLLAIPAFLSCSEPRERREALDRAVAVMNAQPDSALAVLDSLLNNGQHIGKHFRMQCSLHRLNAINKLDTVFKTTEPAEQLAEHFDNHGTSNEKMLAHYLLGRAYQDMGESPMALKCFQDAVTKADTTAKDCDYAQLSRVYGQMADIFYEHQSPLLSINMNRQAYTLANKAGDSIHATIFYWNIAAGFLLDGKKDSALHISQHAADLFIKYGYIDLAAGTLPIQFNLLLEKKRYKAAKVVMDKYELYSGFVDSTGFVKNGYEEYYMSKGMYYDGINKLDSAIFFYRMFLQKHSDMSDRETGYRGLLSVYQKLEQHDSIAKYCKLFAEANDSANIKKSALEITRMQALYNYHEKERIAYIKTNEAKDYKFYATLGGLLFIILCCWGGRFYYIRKQEASRKIRALNSKYFDAMTSYHKIQEELSMLKHGTNELIKKKEIEIRKYQELLESHMKDNEEKEKWDKDILWLDIKEVAQFHELAKNIKSPTEIEWNTLKKIVNDKLPLFMQQIHSDKYCLTEKEIRTTILIRLRFIPSEISVLLCLSMQRITNIRSSINKKIFKGQGTKSLDFNILHL